MKTLMVFFLSTATSFASVDPVKVMQSLAGLAQPGASAKALAKEAGTTVTSLSGSQDPNAVGFWIMDTTLSKSDSLFDTVYTYSYRYREEVYLASDGSFDARTQLVLAINGLAAIDTTKSRALGNWTAASGKLYTQSTSGVSWSSLTQATTMDSTGTDTSGYTFLNGSYTLVQIIGGIQDTAANSSDTLVYQKTGTSAAFTLPALVASPILARSAGASRTLSDTRLPSLFLFQNRYYRLDGAREIIPENP